ncbi:MAG: hypothetical protein H6738_24185 [Alphaproteobacteria bacterium]|nr:hypothetical protein [Alphaproteobacteria bacterium]MCB9690217.1 hypothetical protein [Alphaproteobacteria bacterium]MCB9699908.1 hypothetical protein [Alphaproteobacteria bacterium]
MRTLFWKLLSPLAVVAPLVLLLGRTAPASDPELVQRLRTKLASSDRLFAVPRFWRIGRHNPESRAVIRAEPGNQRIAIQEDGYHSWVYMDGELTLHSPSTYFTGPRRIERFEMLLSAILAEVHSGLAHTTFIPEIPPIPLHNYGSMPEHIDEFTGMQWGSYRVDLPGPFDDELRVYVTLLDAPTDPDEQCFVHSVRVFDQQGALVDTSPYREPGTPLYSKAGRIIMDFDLCGYVYWNPDWQAARYGAIPPFLSRDYDVKLIEDDEYGDMTVVR